MVHGDVGIVIAQGMPNTGVVGGAFELGHGLDKGGFSTRAVTQFTAEAFVR